MNDKSRRVLEEGDDSEGSTERRAKLVGPGSISGKEVARLEHERIADLERQLSETLAERDGHIARAARLTDQLAQKSALLEQAEANASEEKKCAGLELRELQAKLGESLLSRDHALQQAQSALQEASCAAEANEQSQRELTEMRAELEARKSELAALRLRLADTEHDCAKSKAEADTYRNENATDLVNTDETRVVHKLMERMQAMEAEMASLRWKEKGFEMMECRNEG
jgi:chromosome segregation ATPase